MSLPFLLFLLRQRYIPTFALLVLLTLISSLEAVPKRSSYAENQVANVNHRDTRENLESLKHLVNNQETEMRIYEEKLSNQETIIEALRQEIQESSEMNKNLLKELSAALELKIGSLDTTSKGLIADVRQIKSHANDSLATLMQYKQQVSELEKSIELQNQNMENLRLAVKSLMDMMQVKSSLSDSSEKTYRVKLGDSLGAIAKNFQTTTKTIKELNGLASDRIMPGQILKLP